MDEPYFIILTVEKAYVVTDFDINTKTITVRITNRNKEELVTTPEDLNYVCKEMALTYLLSLKGKKINKVTCE